MGKRAREKREKRLSETGAEQIKTSSSNLERLYLSIIEWGTYLILFTPLILVRSYFFPYVCPKTIFFRILVDIIFIVYILLVVSYPKYRPKMNAITIALIVFLLITILTSLTGINFERSFWSTFERMTGVITLLHLFVFFVILTSVFKKREQWEKILTVSILVGILLCFYVLTSADTSSRGGGTIGNTSFLAAYLLFDIFFAMILFFTKKGGLKFFFGVILTILLSGLFISSEPCQGAIGAFFGGLFILFFGYLIFYFLSSKRKLIRYLAPLLIILIIFGVAGFSQTNFFKKELTEIEESNSWQARAIVWQMSYDGWKERPLLGWGQENFNIPFVKYFYPELPLTNDVWYDRAHNIVLDVMISSGILGLLSYLSIFGIAIFGLLRISSKIKENKDIFFPLGMIALLLVYFAQNIWVFDMVSSYMIFFLCLGFVSFLIQKEKLEELEPVEPETKGIHSFIGALLIIITILCIYFGNIQPARSSQYIVKGISSSLESAIPFFQKAITISPMALLEGSEQFSRKMTGLTFNEQVDRQVLARGFELSIIEIEKAIAENPDDFRLYLILGRQYNDFFHLTQDEKKLEQAEITLKEAIDLSLGNQQGYWALAQTKLSQGNAQKAIELMTTAVDLEPRFTLSQWYLAMTYKAIGNYQMALEKVMDAENVGFNWKGNLDNLKKVIDICQNLQDDKQLVELYPLAMELEPTNAQFPAGLAVAYANLGDFDKAREMAALALELNPGFANELNEFLETLPR